MALDLTGYNLTFNDDFDSFTSTPQGSGSWQSTIYGARNLPNNHEQQFYSDATVGVDPFSLANGALTITASPGSNPDGLQYNSGAITTLGDFQQQYGYFEMSAKLPEGSGMWPGFWLLPTHHAWPPEIDVLEAFGAPNSRGEGGPNQVHINAISSVDGQSDGKWVDVPGNIYNEFHSYGVDWQPDYLTYYVDGQQVGQVKTPDDMHTPMYILANLAVGGDWVESPAGETGQMTIDHIRAYSKDSSHAAVAQTSPASAEPDTAHTADASLMPPTASTQAAADTHGSASPDTQADSAMTAMESSPSTTSDTAPSTGTATVDASGATAAENAASPSSAGTHGSDVPTIGTGSSNAPAGDAFTAPATDANTHSVTGSTGTATDGSADTPASGTATAETGATLRVSADSWNGSPEFLVYVDGQQVGDVHTATADHAAGQWQDVAIGGPADGGAHTVWVKFVNDAYGGAGSDRNLYVQSLDMNGHAIAGSEATNNAAQGHESDDPHAAVMMADGAVEFHVPQNTAGSDLWHV